MARLSRPKARVTEMNSGPYQSIGARAPQGGAATARHSRNFRRRRSFSLPSAVTASLIGLLIPAFLLVAWTTAAAYGWLPEQILPAPGIVWQTFLENFNDGTLRGALVVSLGRVARGFALGSVVGLPVGLLFGLLPRARAAFEPFFLIISQVPTLGWIPVLVLLVGIDDGLKLIVIGWSAFVPVVLNTAQGIRAVPPAYMELGRVLSFNRWSFLGTIVLPSAVPSVFTGLREGLANSWQTLVAVELIASFEGLGYLMAYGRQLFQLDLVLVAMGVVGLAGLTLNYALSLFEGRLQRWRPEAAQ